MPWKIVLTASAIGALTPVSLFAQQRVEGALLQHAAGIDYSYQTFHGDIDPWRIAAFTVSERGSRGSVIGRVNYANRFASSGVQVEVDAYPRLTPRVYAYLNAGYSTASIFPTWRSGGELFTSLPNAWEASLGYRQLRFSGLPVTLLTGAVGKYIGNYWFSLRPYVRVTANRATAFTGLTARKYFADADEYVGATVGYGNGLNDLITPDQVARQNSRSAGVHGSNKLTRVLLGTWSAGVDREELSAGRVRKSVSPSAGLKLKF